MCYMLHLKSIPFCFLLGDLWDPRPVLGVLARPGRTCLQDIHLHHMDSCLSERTTNSLPTKRLVFAIKGFFGTCITTASPPQSHNRIGDFERNFQKKDHQRLQNLSPYLMVSFQNQIPSLARSDQQRESLKSSKMHIAKVLTMKLAQLCQD